MIRMSLACLFIFFGWTPSLFAQVIATIQVEGNIKVERDAILSQMVSRQGQNLSPEQVAEDIRKLYELGYFKSIKIYETPIDAQKTVLTVLVAEKPAITAIEFRGLKELSDDDFKEKLQTTLYTIVNESQLQSDLQLIEKMYSEKGFYLAKVTYSLESRGPHDVAVIFQVEESGKVMVADVAILGNQAFSDSELIDQFMSQPVTRMSSYGQGSIYAEELITRDNEFLSYYYQDWGYAQVKVASPIVKLDKDRRYVRATFGVEEGLQYHVGKIDVEGDLLFPKDELIANMKLKPKELFRYSRFTADIEKLMDRYGDLGYAYADVNPKTTFHPETQTVDIVYDITKGAKVYFGKIVISGNTKTRDNVIRREMTVHDSELYSGTGLSESKKNINRLGYFEEVQVVKERDNKDESLLNLNIKVKEKPTGQLQAAVGYSPGAETQKSVFGRGRYDEQNQSGKGWHTNLTAEWDGGDNYKYEAGFTDPKVNDSEWSLGLDASYQKSISNLADEIQAEETRRTFSVTIGRKIIELIRGSITYQRSMISQYTEQITIDRFRSDGVKSTMIFGVSRKDVDNYIDPTEGSQASASHSFTGGVLKGDFSFMETLLNYDHFIPLDFSDTYRTYFKLHGTFGLLSPYEGDSVPFFERYRLGYYDLRGYKYRDPRLAPTVRVLRSPMGSAVELNKGGNKQFYSQFEYYLPLIPKAGIKSLLFYDFGRVYDDDEKFTVSNMYRDIGFGIRWITPIAPFRFEWAYPIEEDGSLGNMEVIFRIGY